MVTAKPSNKRKALRVNCTVPVEGKQGGIFDDTATVDISKGGMGFISRKQIPVNKKIAIEITLDQEEDPVLVVGRVRWVKYLTPNQLFRIGLKFINILSGRKSRLSDYFAQKTA